MNDGPTDGHGLDAVSNELEFMLKELIPRNVEEGIESCFTTYSLFAWSAISR